jgi:CheY-like chemotaxis protein
MVADGTEAIAYLKGWGEFSDRQKFQYPSFILTDLKMPLGDGMILLEYLKRNPASAIIPTIVLSSSCDLDDIKTAYALGASSYIVKPQRPEALHRIIKLLYEFWLECEVPQVDLSGKQLPTRSGGKMSEHIQKKPSASQPVTLWKNEIPFEIEKVLGHIDTLEDQILQNRENTEVGKAVLARIAKRIEASKINLIAAKKTLLQKDS